jgi:iron complex outermembrane receptor protein
MNGAFGHYLFNNTAASVLATTNLPNRNIAKSLIGVEPKEALPMPCSITCNLEKGNYLKMTNATISYRVGNVGKVLRT